MAKYGKYGPQVPPPERPYTIHPIWRGIGCLLIVLIPVTSYAGAALLVDLNLKRGWFTLSSELTNPIIIPYIGRYIPLFNQPIPHLYANLLLGGLLILGWFGLVMIVYAMVYSVIGPERYGPLDSPPIRLRQKYRRKK